MRLSTSSAFIYQTPAKGAVYTPKDAMRIFKNSGYDYIDACLWAYGKDSEMPLWGDNWRTWTEQYVEDLKETGLKVCQTHGMTLGGMEWDDPSLAEYAERVWLVNARCLEATAMMGAKCMVMHPANLPHDPLYSAKKAKEANLRYLAPFIEQAKRLGVKIAVENMVEFRDGRRRYCGGQPEELLELVETIGDPSVGICVDTGHANTGGIPAGAYIRAVGKHLLALHIDDNNGKTDSHSLPYFGTVDWDDVMKALSEIGYEEDFSFEVSRARVPNKAIADYCRFTCELGHVLLAKAT